MRFFNIPTLIYELAEIVEKYPFKFTEIPPIYRQCLISRHAEARKGILIYIEKEGWTTEKNWRKTFQEKHGGYS